MAATASVLRSQLLRYHLERVKKSGVRAVQVSGGTLSSQEES